MTRQNMQSTLFFAVFIVLFIVVALLLRPFLSVILWSSILYVIINPAFRRLSGADAALKAGRQPSRLRKGLAAGSLSVLSAILIVVPLGFLAYLMIRQTSEIINDIISYVSKRPDFFTSSLMAPLAERIKEVTNGAVDLASVDIKQELISLLQSNRNSLGALSLAFVKNLGSFTLAIAFIMFTLYFFFTDGPYLLDLFIKAIPIRVDYMRHFVDRFRDTTRQLIMGNLLVSLIQGCIAFLIFAVFRVEGALLLAALVSACSFIPMIGAGAVWFPVSLSYIFLRSLPGGIALFLISAVGISLLDNFYRPILVGGPIKIHPLPIFFSIVGGIALFGINGIILGPLCLALFFTALDIFRGQMPGVSAEAGTRERAGERPKEGGKAGEGEGGERA